MEERRVDCITFFFENSDHDLDSLFPQKGDSAAGHQRIRVEGADDDPADSAFENRVGAGRISAGVAAGLEVDIERRSLRGAGAVPKRVSLCVWPAVPFVPAFSQRPAVPDDDCSDQRIGIDLSDAPFCQMKRPPHPLFVLHSKHLLI
jgi:hypothetical protein